MPVSGFVVIISPGAPIGSVGVAIRSGASLAARSRRWIRSTNSRAANTRITTPSAHHTGVMTRRTSPG